MKKIKILFMFLILLISNYVFATSSSFIIKFNKDKINLPSQKALSGLCSSLPANSPSKVYSFDINGSSFSTYCDMTHEGGGWTLVAVFLNSQSWGSVSSLDLSKSGYINNSQIWNKLNLESNPMMLFTYQSSFQDSAQISYKGITSSSICYPFNGFASNGSEIFHAEASGCNGTGVDYTMAKISSSVTPGFWNFDSGFKFLNVTGNFFNSPSYPGYIGHAHTGSLYVFVK